MSASGDTVTVSHTVSLDGESAGGTTRSVPALVILWSRAQPERVGEIALIPPGAPPQVLGRGDRSGDDGERLRWYRQRPGVLAAAPPLEGARLSRDQLRLRTAGNRLQVERIGRCALLVNGREQETAELSPGVTLMLQPELLLLCVARPWRMAALQSFPATEIPQFGTADRFGLVGESPALWRLRERIAFLAKRDAHLLLLGPSGTGKELAAGAVHALSSRHRRAMVSRNAATFPPGLVDAELFGNIKDYPNAGMRERPGLVGAANQSTLFLDEIGELSEDLQTHLLRVLDRDGTYQRLGEAEVRRADLRLLAATNRSPDLLRPDLRARLSLELGLPGLEERREDIPLLVRHLLGRTARGDPDLARRFFGGGDPDQGEPRLAPRLVERLVLHPYQTHVRELEALLWQSMTSSQGDFLDLTDEVQARLGATAPLPTRREPSAEEIVACLERLGGNQSAAWKELGLSSRHVLYRLLRKHGLDRGSRVKSE